MKIGWLLVAAGFLVCAPGVSLAGGTIPQASHAAAAGNSKSTQPVSFAKPVVHIRVAPADEYFGHQKISILGINNTIHDTNMRIGFDRVHAAKFYGTLAAAEDSLQDWASKYPQDTWLPGRAYYMSHVFWQMHTPDGDSAAARCRDLLLKKFPSSHWAALAKTEKPEIIAPVSPEEIAARNAANSASAANATNVTVGGPAAALNANRNILVLPGSAPAAPAKPKR